MNGHFVCDICGAIRPASETVHICEHARKPDALCVKECTHWGRSQEECISDHDGLCKGKDGELFRDYCDTRCACLYPAKRKLPAPPLPICAPGQGQGTEEERVERVTRAIRETQWANMRDDEFARILLAAADAVPGPAVDVVDKDAELFPCADCGVLRSIHQGAQVFTVCDECWEKSHPPEVEWSTEPPKETDTWWWVQIETLTPQIVFYIASDTVLKSGDERPHHVHEFSRWWPVPISEPPRGGTK